MHLNINNFWIASLSLAIARNEAIQTNYFRRCLLHNPVAPPGAKCD